MVRKNIIFILSILVLSGLRLAAQEWTVPADQSALKNPMPYVLENVETGKDLYNINCKSCHGDPGKNNSLQMSPLPPDIASEKMQSNSDGDLYYKITTGKGVMPRFDASLSEKDRWNIVNFIRNYSPDREALIIEKPPVKAQVWASINEENASVEVIVESLEPGKEKDPLAGVPVNIGIRKTFGNLNIGEVITDEEGRGKFVVPSTIIGDETGKVNIIVSLNEDYEAKNVVLDNAMIATPKDVSGLIRPGVIWSTNENIPIWLLLLFLSGVGAAWITIFYVIVKILKIRKLGTAE